MLFSWKSQEIRSQWVNITTLWKVFLNEYGPYLTRKKNLLMFVPKTIGGRPELSETWGRKKTVSVRIIYEEYGFIYPTQNGVKPFIKSCLHFLSPQVRLKMNDKKPSQFQFYFSGVLEAFSMLKKWKKKFLLAWTSEIIQFIRYPIQMDRTERSNFFGGKGWLFIVIQLCYSGLWPFSH